MGKINGKVAIVTGGAKGIGSAISRLFASEGAAAIINYNKSESEAKELLQEIGSKNGNAEIYRANVGIKDECIELIEYVINKYKRLDILVNNAGITKDNLLVSMEEKEWEDVMNINLNSIFYLCKNAVQQMIYQRSGIIINISSISAEVGGKGHCNYAAAKGGINSFTYALADEVGYKGIRVNAISPGFIEGTDMAGYFLNEDNKKYFLQHIPMRKFGNPEDVAKLALFLASEDSAYITGQVININGGYNH